MERRGGVGGVGVKGGVLGVSGSGKDSQMVVGGGGSGSGSGSGRDGGGDSWGWGITGKRCNVKGVRCDINGDRKYSRGWWWW